MIRFTKDVVVDLGLKTAMIIGILAWVYLIFLLFV